MRRFVIGNWKCYKSSSDARAWFDAFAAAYRPVAGLSVIIAPSFICLEKCSDYLQGLHLPGVFLAAQDISAYPKGAYTGAVAADMVKGLADYVIVGHSERRRYFHETPRDIAGKLSEAADAGLKAILCIADPDELVSLRTLQDADWGEIIIVYAPVDALNFRIPAPVKQVSDAAERIAAMKLIGPVVYGGAVYPDNALTYARLPGIAGLIVGESSLETAKFAAICRAFEEG